jgi:protease I
MTNILIPLSTHGFDPTEAAIPWRLLSQQGYQVVFSTPGGTPATADQRMLTGEGLGIWRGILRARQDAVAAYREMEKDPAFLHPLRYSEINAEDIKALLLPGGHDKGVREYLESMLLQKTVADFFLKQKPVAAICHGVVLAARSVNPLTQNSVLFEYKTTSLLKSQENAAHNLTRMWLGDYYLTYPGLTVEDEVTAALSSKENFIHGPAPLFRDDLEHMSRGFVVKDRNYLSARWPGDVYNFSVEFAKMLQ